ncbi:MAG: type IV toxin-antitoxin system AbiEi family antitoxin [Gammaproteobacteria bacterium]
MHMKDEKMTLKGYLERLQSQGQYWFLREEVMGVLKLSESGFKQATRRLIKHKMVNRIRGDFYTIVPLEYRATGSLPAAWFIDTLMTHLKQKYYVGLLTAASLHGAAHQQPMIFQIITDKPTRPISVGQLRIVFYIKKNILPHFYTAIKTNTGSMQISTPEITAYDLVRYINASGQINNVATVLSELAEKLRINVMATLLESNEVEITDAQRVGYLLDVLKLPIDFEALSNALEKKKKLKRLLVNGSKRPIIEYNRRWHILVNEIVEPDEL